ncbi:MAG: ABC transporter permease [candidate division KSB1 bacterium]|nr:ABC transporter permease [candidate division KSB1 bacterium]MDZ7301416.1 ABC transporter permease [candidate division KSB1 bacterium]MDZ7313450.1 ABC transporter permease [candidate division KSB1 bacterium]
MNLLVNIAGQLGRQTIHFLVHLDRMMRLGADTLWWAMVAPFKGKRLRWHSMIEQMVRIGFDSVPIVCTISFFVGLIMAMQSAYQLERFGATIFVADLVAVSIIRELGPLLTAIIIAGRSGSGIAAEIGTMKVSEELDALRTMGLNPISFLVVPRTLAMVIVLPCLTLLSDLVGILGGFFIAVTTLDISAIRYYHETANALVVKDLTTGLVKTVFFAIIIASVGSYQGFIVEGGAEGVGKSTTASVVASIFLIIAADVFFTALFYSTF